jgi:hypothetical protein
MPTKAKEKAKSSQLIRGFEPYKEVKGEEYMGDPMRAHFTGILRPGTATTASASAKARTMHANSCAKNRKWRWRSRTGSGSPSVSRDGV